MQAALPTLVGLSVWAKNGVGRRMPGNFLFAEEYRNLLCEFAGCLFPAEFSRAGNSKGPDYDPLRLRPLSESILCVEKLLGTQSDVPMAWRLGQYWAANAKDLISARALCSLKIVEALEVAYRNQALFTNARTIAHRSRTSGEMAAVHHCEMAHDPIARFLFHASMAAKLCHIFQFYRDSDRQHQIDVRANSFGQLMERFERELDFIDIEFREAELTMGFRRDVLESRISDGDGRLIATLDRELARRAAELPEQSTWCDRIKYHIRSNHLSEVSLEEICDTFRVQRRTLGRLLRDEGTTFTSILTELRREKALHLVGNTGVPLKRVAAELGFNSDASFNMAFKSWTGMTPMRFRKAIPAKLPANDWEADPRPMARPTLSAQPAITTRPLLATFRPCGRSVPAH